MISADKTWPLAVTSEAGESLDEFRHAGTVISACYVFFVLVLKQHMKNRPGYSLKFPLFLWNASFTAFNFVGAMRIVPEIWHELTYKGAEHSLCNSDSSWHNVVGFWSHLFMISKIFELGETMFAILRKERLSIFHYYHRAASVAFVFYWYLESGPALGFLVGIAFCFRSFTHCYHALENMDIRAPKMTPPAISIAQLIENLLNLAVCYCALHFDTQRESLEKCQVVRSSMEQFAFLYASFLVFQLDRLNSAYFGQPSIEEPFEDLNVNLDDIGAKFVRFWDGEEEFKSD